MVQKYDISGMTCSACSAAVERSVKKLPGVDKVNVNLLTNTLTLETAQNQPSAIIKAVADAGYKARIEGETDRAADANPLLQEMTRMKKRLLISVIFLIPLLYVSMGHMIGLPLLSWLQGVNNAVAFAFTQMLLTLPILFVNRKYYEIGARTLWKRSPNMDSLVAIGTFSAFLYGVFAIYMIGYGLGNNRMDLVHTYHQDLYFEVAAVVLVLITVGKYLEARSKGKTSAAIEKLMDLAPKTALLLVDGEELEIPVEDINPGDMLRVKPGQSIPADGEIVAGSTAIDQSSLTGESIPVAREKGDKIIAATINKTGTFTFRAEKVGDDTTLAQIIRLVQDANATKAPIARLADKVSSIFVPAVMSIAAVTIIVWLILGYYFDFALSMGITVLVISCPCALGLATPVSIMVGTGQGARHGILVKSAQALELLHKVDTVVLDKTGTVTAGKPVVTDIMPMDGQTENQLLQLAGSLEKPSEHPLAEAVMNKVQAKQLTIQEVDSFTAVPGKGLEAVLTEERYFAGNAAFLLEQGIDTEHVRQISEDLSRQGKTPMFFAMKDRLLGVIAVADQVKPTSGQAIQKLKSMGLNVVMLTGDNQKTAEAIRADLDIDKVIAEVMPQDKENEIQLLQKKGRKVAMIGDGINDAPALARADVGIAIGAGTDIAIDSADIVLMKNDLLDAVTAIELSRATLRNIKGNLFWAFFYNTIGIPLAAGVFYLSLGWRLTPMFGAVAMSLSSLFVVSNALRLRFFRPQSQGSSKKGV